MNLFFSGCHSLAPFPDPIGPSSLTFFGVELELKIAYFLLGLGCLVFLGSRVAENRDVPTVQPSIAFLIGTMELHIKSAPF